MENHALALATADRRAGLNALIRGLHNFLLLRVLHIMIYF
jgi:hypothetical protein